MAPVASPFPAQKAAPRGLWQALVDADAARSSSARRSLPTAVVESVDPGTQVIGLASHAQAHLGYLERVAAGVRNAPSAVVPDGSADLTEPGWGVVIDLAQHRSRRSLIA